jgi:hypothetical protein
MSVFDQEVRGRCHRTIAGFLVALSAALAGCTEGDSDLPPPASPPPATAGGTATATVAPEHVPIIEGFRAFVTAANRAANEADPDYPELAERAEGQALIQTEIDIEDAAEAGRRYVGEVTIVSAEVTDVDMDVPYPIPNATLRACMDVSNYILIDDESQSPVPVERELAQFIAVVLMRHSAEDDRWIVVRVEPEPDRPC